MLFRSRAYDQVLHDVALHRAPVILALDRAGCVGNDGPTHHGMYDLAYLRHIPNMVIMAPKDEVEMLHMMQTALAYTDGPDAGPIALRYPRCNVVGLELPDELVELPIGRGEILREGEKVALLGIGTMSQNALAAAEALAEQGISVTVANARFVKPLDRELVVDLAKRHDHLLTIEDHSVVGGFGSAVAEALAGAGVSCRLTILGVRDEFVEHGERDHQLAWHGLDVESLTTTVRAIWEGKSDETLKLVG